MTRPEISAIDACSGGIRDGGGLYGDVLGVEDNDNDAYGDDPGDGLRNRIGDDHTYGHGYFCNFYTPGINSGSANYGARGSMAHMVSGNSSDSGLPLPVDRWVRLAVSDWFQTDEAIRT